MAAVEEWQKGHDRLCAERYKSIGEGIAQMRAGLSGIKAGQNKGVWMGAAVLISLVGWMGVQLWSGQQAEITRLREAPAAVSTRTVG